MTGGSVNTYHNTELNTPLLNFDDNQQTDITSQQFGPSDGFMPYGPAMGPPMGPPMGLPMGPPMGPGMFERFRFAVSKNTPFPIDDLVNRFNKENTIVGLDDRKPNVNKWDVRVVPARYTYIFGPTSNSNDKA